MKTLLTSTFAVITHATFTLVTYRYVLGLMLLALVTTLLVLSAFALHPESLTLFSWLHLTALSPLNGTPGGSLPHGDPYPWQ